MADSDNDESVFSFENEHQNIRTGFMDEESTYYSDEKRTLNKPNKVLRVDPVKNKPVKVEFFETILTPNRFIKNAVTGVIEAPFRVGSSDEDLFFSVMLSTGECGKTPPCLFYDSPEQYERHFYTTVSEETKLRWRNRYAQAVYNRNKKNERSKEEVIEVK
jgi:hypothetical protein